MTRRADVLIDGPQIASVGRAARPPAGCEVIDLAPGQRGLPGLHRRPRARRGAAAGRRAGGRRAGPGGDHAGRRPGRAVVDRRHRGHRAVPEPVLRAGQRRAGPGPRPRAWPPTGTRWPGGWRRTSPSSASQGTIRHNVAGLAARPAGARRAGRRAAAGGGRARRRGGRAVQRAGLPAEPVRRRRARSPTWPGRWPRRGGPTSRTCAATARRSGPAWTSWWRSGRGAGIRVHASHLWGSAGRPRRPRSRAAEAAGVGVTFDMYPYRRSSTILAMLLLPPEVQARGPEHTLAALADPGQRAALLAGRSSPTISCATSTWAACPPRPRGSPGSR